MLVIPALERLRQEAYCKFKVSLGCRMRQCLKVKTKASKNPQNQTKEEESLGWRGALEISSEIHFRVHEHGQP